MTAPLRLRSLASLLLLGVLAAGCGTFRAPQHYLIPDGFSGWVYVQYDNPSCPALEVRAGRQVVRVPSNGRVCTSTKYETGVATDLWEYVRPDGSTRPLDRDSDIHLFGFRQFGHYNEFRVGLSGGQPDPSPFP